MPRHRQTAQYALFNLLHCLSGLQLFRHPRSSRPGWHVIIGPLSLHREYPRVALFMFKFPLMASFLVEVNWAKACRYSFSPVILRPRLCSRFGYSHYWNFLPTATPSTQPAWSNIYESFQSYVHYRSRRLWSGLPPDPRRPCALSHAAAEVSGSLKLWVRKTRPQISRG
jgi:hypothetical protein